MKITALTPQEHHPERVSLFVDGEFRLGLASEIAFSAGLRLGDPIDETTLLSLERQDLHWRTREAALHLLAYRARTEVELRRRLLRKGYPDEAVAECVRDLVDRGLVDDAGFAATFVRDRVRSRPRGTRLLVHELRARGVAEETARSIVDRTLVTAEVSELDLAREAAAGWARRVLSAKVDGRGPEDAAGPRELQRKLFGYLARRGFGSEVIRAAADGVLDRRDD